MSLFRMIGSPGKDGSGSSRRESRRSSKVGEASKTNADDDGEGDSGGEEEENKAQAERGDKNEQGISDKPRRSRAMSIAPAVAQFLSSAAAKRRPSREPQFMTVSPNFTTRSTRPWSQSSFSRPRHSIDIRNLPTYLARHRQSIVGTRLFESFVEGDMSKSKSNQLSIIIYSYFLSFSIVAFDHVHSIRFHSF